MKDIDLLKLILRNGWTEDRINSSHRILLKNSKVISLPVHRKNIKKGIEAAIFKQAGLK